MSKLPPERGWHLSQMFEGMERGELRTLYVMGENPAQSEADSKKAIELLEGLDFLIAQDILMTKTCELADVVLPSSASWCEADGGTVTNSERRVQRLRKALDPPGQARDDHWIISELARRLGHDWGEPTLEQAWDELRSLSPMHRGMSYRATRGARRHPVAVPERGRSGIAVPAWTSVGGAGRGAARRRSRSVSGCRRSTS